MRKERSERYRSASELADDIDNFLNGAPLIAGPPSNIYIMKKFARRHRAPVIGLAAVLAVLIAGVVVSTFFAIGQARARRETQYFANFLMNDVLGSAKEARVGEATISYVLDAASEKLEVKFDDRPLVRAAIHQKLGSIYGDTGELEKGEQQYLQAIRIYQTHLGDEHPYTRAAWNGIGWNVYEEQGRYHDMERIWTGGKPGNGLAIAYYYLGKYEEAASIFEQTLERHGDKPGSESFRAPRHVVNNLARVYTAQGRYEEAEKLFDKMRILDANPRDAGRYIAELANLYREQGRYSKAQSLLDRTLEALRRERGGEHYFTLMSMQVLACLYIDQGRYEEAEVLLNEAIPTARGRLREHHPLTLRFVNARAVLHTKQGEYNDAEPLFKQALEGRRSELGDDHPETLQTINDLGILRREQGRYKEAETLITEAFEKRTAKLGPDHPQTQESLNLLIDLCKTLHQPEEAEKWREKLPQRNDPEE
jgi:pentatricopeptide repeat protein